MQKYFDTVLRENGTPISGATVLVKNYPSGTTATIYSDNGSSTTGNPLTTNARGYFEFYAADGRYSLVISSADTGTVTINDVLIEDPISGTGDTLTNPTINGTVATTGLTLPAFTGGAINGTTIPTSKTLTVTTDKLSVFASTTSAELAGVISDETGSGALVFANTPTLTTPNIGAATGSSLNIGTGALTAGSGTFSGQVKQQSTGQQIVVINSTDAGTTAGSGGAFGVQANGSYKVAYGVRSAIIGSGTDQSAYIQSFSDDVYIHAATSGKSIYAQVNNSTIGTFSSTGLAVTGAVSASGTIGGTAGSALKVGTDSTAGSGTIFNNDTWGMGFVAADTATNLFGWFDKDINTKMTLDASGNLGIGVTPSGWGSNYKALDIGGNVGIAGYSNSLYQMANAYAENAAYKYKASTFASMYLQSAGQHQWYTAPSGTAGNAITFTTAMTLDANGNLLVGGTTAYGRLSVERTSDVAVCASLKTPQYCLDQWATNTSGDNVFTRFFTEGGSGTQRGSIDYNRTGGLVRYNTTSDATLKNIIGDAPQQKSIDILTSTRLREYSWKEDATNKPQIGVIAQELYETFKGAVSVGGEYEETDADGNTVTKYRPWAVDKTAFTFHLVAGFQYLKQENEQLKAQLSAIESRLAALEGVK